MKAPALNQPRRSAGWYQRRRRRQQAASGQILHPSWCRCVHCASAGPVATAITDTIRVSLWGAGLGIVAVAAIAITQNWPAIVAATIGSY